MIHESLITNLTLYYQTLATLHYVSHSDILSPPNTMNISAANDAGLSPEAISLLQRLPQLNPDLYSLALLPDGTQPVSYLDDDLSWLRAPTFRSGPEISAHAFLLSNPNIYGTSLIYDTASAKLLAWEAWGKHIDLEIAEIEDPFKMDNAKSPDQIFGPWIAKLLALDWVPFESELIKKPTEDEVEAAKGDVDMMAGIQIVFIKFNFRQIYLDCGWNGKAKDLNTAKKYFDDKLFEIKKTDWKEQTQKILDQAYEEQWEWSRIRTRLGLEGNSQIALLDDCLAEGQQMRHLEV